MSISYRGLGRPLGPRGDLLSGKDGQLEGCAGGKKQGKGQRGRERGEREKETRGRNSERNHREKALGPGGMGEGRELWEALPRKPCSVGNLA